MIVTPPQIAYQQFRYQPQHTNVAAYAGEGK
jgi:hypothetical protein